MEQASGKSRGQKSSTTVVLREQKHPTPEPAEGTKGRGQKHLMPKSAEAVKGRGQKHLTVELPEAEKGRGKTLTPEPGEVKHLNPEPDEAVKGRGKTVSADGHQVSSTTVILREQTGEAKKHFPEYYGK